MQAPQHDEADMGEKNVKRLAMHEYHLDSILFSVLCKAAVQAVFSMCIDGNIA